jgi:hypothetical protein
MFITQNVLSESVQYAGSAGNVMIKPKDIMQIGRLCEIL